MSERTRGPVHSAAHDVAHDPAAAQRLAERVADGMFVNDRASRGLGMQIASVAPGRAEMTMTVREDMLNGHAMCHGGFIFLLADSTFAFACNSYNRNTVAQGCSIDYLAPAHLGDVLHASGVERSRTGRTGPNIGWATQRWVSSWPPSSRTRSWSPQWWHSNTRSAFFQHGPHTGRPSARMLTA